MERNPVPYWPLRKKFTAASTFALAVVGAVAARACHLAEMMRRDRKTAFRLKEQHQELLQHQEEMQAQQDQLVASANDLSTANTRLECASRRFEELYQALPTPCFCYDERGHIFEWNRALEIGFGLTPDRIFQRAVWEAVGTPSEVDFLKRCVAGVFEGEAPESWEQVWTPADGRIGHWLCRAFPLRNQEGTITGGIHVYMDITDRKVAEEALRHSEERLRAFHDITADPDAGFSEKVDRLLRLGCQTLGMDFGLIVEGTGADQHIRHLSTCDAVETVPTQASIATPLYVGDTEWGVLRFTSSAVRAAVAQTDKDFLRLMAQWIGGEVERSQAQQAISESDQRFRSAIDSMQEGFIVQDREGTILICNGTAAHTLGAPVEELLNHSIVRPGWHAVRADGSDFPRPEQPSRVALATGQGQQGVVLGMKNPSDDVVTWLSMNAAPLYRAGEEMPYAVVLTYTDITERRQQETQIAASLEQIREYNALLELQKKDAEAQKRILERTNMSLEVANAALESLATQDGLTGLKNHRAFQERLELELCRARRYDLPLSLVLLDVDHFKQYNDAYGHPAGDEVLAMVARLLDQNGRETDLTARYGGEEFAVILPNTGCEGARVVAERLRTALDDWDWPLRPITASLGVSTLNPTMPDRATMIAVADQALYQAKAAGRNHAIHAADVCPRVMPLSLPA